MPLGINKVALFAAAADTGSAVLLSTATASSSASLEFTLPTAYKQVTFGFYNITPATDGEALQFQVNASGQTGFNETMTTTMFKSYHYESGSFSGLVYETGHDQAQGTAYQKLTTSIGSDSDESGSGTLVLFNPTSTTYVKHFNARVNQYASAVYSGDVLTAGYINVTAAITGIAFKISSGNIATGTIKMWGIK